MRKLLTYILLVAVFLTGCDSKVSPETEKDCIDFAGTAVQAQSITKTGTEFINTSAELCSRSFGIFGFLKPMPPKRFLIPGQSGYTPLNRSGFVPIGIGLELIGLTTQESHRAPMQTFW